MRLGNLFGFIANPGSSWGTNSMIGDALNDITGASSSAKRQYENQLKLQHDAQNFAKWQMNNAHQTEVADLKKAGLNPVISSGGSGASAGVTEGSASTGSAVADPIGMVTNLIGMLNASKQTQSVVDKTEAEIKNLDADTKNKEQTLEWTPALNAAIIKLNTANSYKAVQEAEKIITENAAQQFVNKMLDMNVKKRSGEWDKELEIYKAQLKAILKDANVNNSTIGMIINNIGHTVHQLSPFSDFIPHGGNSYNYSPVSVNY